MTGDKLAITCMSLALLLPQEVLGQYVISGPEEIFEHHLAKFSPGYQEEGVGFIWDVQPFESVDIDEDPDGELVLTGKPGSYLITLRVINFDTREIQTFRHTLTIKGRAPPPEPDPDDDDPLVPPDPPEPTKDLRVLLVYESSRGMSTAKRNVFYSTEVASYLNQKTTAGSDGIRSWRRWDKDIVNQEAPQELRDLWDAVRTQINENQLPVIVIAHHGKAEIFDLPETEGAVLELLRRFGG